MMFNYEITDFDSWGRVFQSVDEFSLLIHHIFEQCGLHHNKIGQLKAGTNASFLVDDYVIKIFVPIEAGCDTLLDFKQEIFGSEYALDVGIKSYDILFHGEIQDKYLFRYIIYNYVDGEMAGTVVPDYSYEEKKAFIRRLNNMLALMNLSISFFHYYDPVIKSLENDKWSNLPEKLREEVFSELKKIKPYDFVYCHNDITGDNMLISDGDLILIDFADANISPRICEYVTIIFDLFDFDDDLIREFIKDKDISHLFDGILMHEYGFVFLRSIVSRIMHKNINEVSLDEIKKELQKYIEELEMPKI